MDFTAQIGGMLSEAGQSITLKGVMCQAIFDNGYASSLGMDGAGPAITLASGDAAEVGQGDAVVIGGVNYSVVTVEPDGTGMTVIRLQEA